MRKTILIQKTNWLLAFGLLLLPLSCIGQKNLLDSVKALQAAHHAREKFVGDSLRRIFAAQEFSPKEKADREKMQREFARQRREADSLNRISYEQLLQAPPADTLVESLDLSNAAFQEMPAGLGQFPRLKALALSRNAIATTQGFEWEALPMLERISFAQNNLSGRNALPFPNNSTVKELQLSKNQFEQIPKKLHKLKALEKLDLSGNQLHNEKYRRLKLRRMKNLKSLDLSDNQLTKIPRRLKRLKQLEHLNLSNNDISSLKGLHRLKNLKSVNLSFNPVFPHPKYLLQLDSLESLTLRHCHLVWLPEEIGRLTNLKKLVLPENHLETVPATLGKLQQLESLMLYKNKLKTLPKEIFNLSQLLWLDAYYNELTEIPETIGQLEKLEILYLSHNKLDRLPKALSGMTTLRELYAHHNRISNMPDLEQLQQLKVLHLQNNLLAEFPTSVLQIKGLKELKLGKNQLMEFPVGLLDLPDLKLLDVTENPIERGTKAHDQLLQVLEKLQKRGVIIKFTLDGQEIGG